jgi:hypothetical protein
MIASLCDTDMPRLNHIGEIIPDDGIEIEIGLELFLVVNIPPMLPINTDLNRVSCDPLS